jgi:large subunit ribosomal protein L4
VSEPKTKRAIELMKSVGVEDTKCLFVLNAKDDVLMKATRNIPGVKTTIARDLNIHDVMAFDMLVIDREAVGAIVEVLKR